MREFFSTNTVTLNRRSVDYVSWWCSSSLSCFQKGRL